MLDFILDIFDFIYDLFVDPYSEYKSVSKTQGEEAGMDAMASRFVTNALIWGFLILLVVCLASWGSGLMFLFVPSAIGLACVCIAGLRRIIAYFRT